MHQFFSYIATAIATSALAVANPAQADDDIIVNGDTETRAEVQMVSPGVADIAMGPLYGVFLDAVPEGVTAHMSQADDSGKGTASVAKWRKTPYGKARICWKEVGQRWSDTPHCGERYGTQSITLIDLGSRRSEVFALVPVALDADGKELAWIAHPANTQTILRCKTRQDMASIFAVDAQGTVTIADEAERRRYEVQYCGSE
jgi:hypothetical protein